MQYQLLPDLTNDEYQALKTDIAERGVMVPVELDEEGNILDGHHRVRACGELGKDYPTLIRIGLTEAQKRSHVRALNLLRRHLSKDQLQEQWTAMRQDGMTYPEIAQVSGVDETTVMRAVSQTANAVSQPIVNKRGQRRPAQYKPRTKKPTVFSANKRTRQKALTALQTVDAADLADQDFIEPKALDRAAREAEKEAQREELTLCPGALPEAVQLLCGDFTEVADQIAPGTVDAIITDPPYPREHLHCYLTLAEQAVRLLKPGGSLLAMAGQSYLPEVIKMLEAHLTYHWTLAYLTPGGQSPQIWPRKVNTFWKPVLWFVKGEYQGDWHGDVIRSDVNDNDKRFHDWGQSESGMARLVESFTEEGNVVLDPYLGGGTTAVVCVRLGRRFVGIDIDAGAIAATQGRLAQDTQGAQCEPLMA